MRRVTLDMDLLKDRGTALFYPETADKSDRVNDYIRATLTIYKFLSVGEQKPIDGVAARLAETKPLIYYLAAKYAQSAVSRYGLLPKGRRSRELACTYIARAVVLDVLAYASLHTALASLPGEGCGSAAGATGRLEYVGEGLIAAFRAVNKLPYLPFTFPSYAASQLLKLYAPLTADGEMEHDAALISYGGDLADKAVKAARSAQVDLYDYDMLSDGVRRAIPEAVFAFASKTYRDFSHLFAHGAN